MGSITLGVESLLRRIPQDQGLIYSRLTNRRSYAIAHFASFPFISHGQEASRLSKSKSEQISHQKPHCIPSYTGFSRSSHSCGTLYRVSHDLLVGSHDLLVRSHRGPYSALRYGSLAGTELRQAGRNRVYRKEHNKQRFGRRSTVRPLGSGCVRPNELRAHAAC